MKDYKLPFYSCLIIANLWIIEGRIGIAYLWLGICVFIFTVEMSVTLYNYITKNNRDGN